MDGPPVRPERAATSSLRTELPAADMSRISTPSKDGMVVVGTRDSKTRLAAADTSRTLVSDPAAQREVWRHKEDASAGSQGAIRPLRAAAILAWADAGEINGLVDRAARDLRQHQQDDGGRMHCECRRRHAGWPRVPSAELRIVTISVRSSAAHSKARVSGLPAVTASKPKTANAQREGECARAQESPPAQWQLTMLRVPGSQGSSAYTQENWSATSIGAVGSRSAGAHAPRWTGERQQRAP